MEVIKEEDEEVGFQRSSPSAEIKLEHDVKDVYEKQKRRNSKITFDGVATMDLPDANLNIQNSEDRKVDTNKDETMSESSKNDGSLKLDIKNAKNTVISYIKQGLGFGTEEDNYNEEIESAKAAAEVSKEAFLIAADLLISNPYANTVEKFDTFRQLEEIKTQSNDLFPPLTKEAIGNQAAGSYINDSSYINQECSTVLPELPLHMPKIRRESSANCQSDRVDDLSKISFDNQVAHAQVTPLTNISPFKSLSPLEANNNAIDTPLIDVSVRGMQIMNIGNQVLEFDSATKAVVDAVASTIQSRLTVGVCEIFANGAPRQTRELYLDDLYRGIKEECKMISASSSSVQRGDSSGPDADGNNSVYKISKSTLKLFGNGRIDSTSDFIRLNFPITINSIFSSEDTIDADFESKISASKSTIFVRHHTIWVAFHLDACSIRAIILSNRVILFVSKSGDTSIDQNCIDTEKNVIEAIQNEVSGWIKNNEANKSNRVEIPFELNVLRTIVSIVGVRQKKEYHNLQHDIQSYINFLKMLKSAKTKSILSMGLEFHSQHLRHRLSKMVAHVESNVNALNEIVNGEFSEEYMTLLSLTIFREFPEYYNLNSEMRNEKVNSHVQNYSRVHAFESMVNRYILESEALISRIEMSTTLIEDEESLFRLMLNFSQNQILLLNTVLTILACSISFGSYFTGVFGMNLDNTITIQDKHNSFSIVFGGSFGIIIICFFATFIYFKRNGVLPKIIGNHHFRESKKKSTSTKK